MSYTCHSGGAIGADTFWETEGKKYGVNTISYSFDKHDTKSHNRLILTNDQLDEGWKHILVANDALKRGTVSLNILYVKRLLSRNWFQVKNSDAVFAIGEFDNKVKSKVKGGTGWAVQMAIDNKIPVYVFDQEPGPLGAWWVYLHEYGKFSKVYEYPKLTENFAGIGTRKINPYGENAIIEIYKNTFNNE
jgi:hypothetical protein